MSGRRRWALAGAVLGLLLLPTMVWGQGDLSRAERALEGDRFTEAIALAQPFLDRPRARLITAEAMIELGRFSDAIGVLAPLLGDRAPGPNDAPWVRLLARALQGQGLLLEAADWWLTYAGFGRRERREGERQLRLLLRTGLSQGEIAYLLWKYPKHEELCEAAERYIDLELAGGHRAEARRAWFAAGPTCRGAEVGADEVPPSRLQDESDTREPTDFYTIGLLAPLNGPYARFGIGIANGADVGRRLHNARARFPLRLEIADTGGSPPGLIAAIENLYAQGVRVFIGEVFSLHTLMAASYLRDRECVLVSPAATDSSIALMGPGIYACTVGRREQVGAMLTYAADSMAVERLAILGPGSASGQEWMRLVRDRAVRGGMRVELDQAFRPGITDFTDLLESSGGVLPDSVDAVFCSGGMRELVALLSQLANTGFLGPYMGTPAMGEEIVGQVVEEFGLYALYPGETYVALEDYTRPPGFAVTYTRLFGEEPGEFAQRGYTAFGVVGSAIESGGYCVEALRDELEDASRDRRARGEGRRLNVPSRVGVPGVTLIEGANRRLVGHVIAPPPPVEIDTLAAAPTDSLVPTPDGNGSEPPR